MLNFIVIMGRIGSDMEIKKTLDGKSVLSLPVGVDRNRKSADGTYETDWFRCVAWNSTAEMIERNFRKGDLICLVGHMQHRTFTDKTDAKRDVMELIVRNVHFVESRAAREQRRTNGAYYAEAGAFTDDDAPPALPH